MSGRYYPARVVHTNARLAADFLSALECAHDEIEGYLSTKAMRPLKRQILKALRAHMKTLRPMTNAKPTWTRGRARPLPPPTPEVLEAIAADCWRMYAAARLRANEARALPADPATAQGGA